MEGNPQQLPKLFLTTEEILNGTIKYLVSRPYAEVAHLIDALRNSQPFTPPASPPDLEDDADPKTPGLKAVEDERGEEEPEQKKNRKNKK